VDRETGLSADRLHPAELLRLRVDPVLLAAIDIDGEPDALPGDSPGTAADKPDSAIRNPEDTATTVRRLEGSVPVATASITPNTPCYRNVMSVKEGTSDVGFRGFGVQPRAGLKPFVQS
jgi:hypothetical protein